MIGALLTFVAVYFASRYLFDLRPPSYILAVNLLLVASGLGVRYIFGYFHPTGRRWVATRSELEPGAEPNIDRG